MCHLDFGTAIFDGNWSVSWRGRASALGLNQKWNHVKSWAKDNVSLTDITDMIEIEFKTIGKTHWHANFCISRFFPPSWKPFLRNHLKCQFTANLAWSLLASLDLAAVDPCHEDKPPPAADRQQWTPFCTRHFALASCQQLSEEFSLLLFGGPAAVVAKLDPVSTWQGSSSNNYKRNTNMSPMR